MKKLAIFLLLSVMTLGASAQGFYWGVKGGLNLTNISNSDAKMKPSIYVGGFIEYQFTDRWAIQPELLYSRQGFYDKAGEIKAWERFNYINIPILAKFYAVPSKLSVELGPQLGFAVNGKLKVKHGDTKTTSTIDSGVYKNFDFGLGLGVSYYITSMINVSVRYNFGLTDVYKDFDEGSKNQVIQIGAGLRF